MSASDEQREYYKHFQQLLPELLSNPLITGKYAIVCGMAIEGVFDTFEAAYREACCKYGNDFIVQQIVDERKIANYLSPAVAI